jgi:hypothetical protein
MIASKVIDEIEASVKPYRCRRCGGTVAFLYKNGDRGCVACRNAAARASYVRSRERILFVKWHRWHGVPCDRRTSGRVAEAPPDRFLSKVERTESGCWLWTGGISKDGYGKFPVLVTPGKPFRWVRAHRWSYEHFIGPIPPKLTLDHLCRVRNCVNPEHLEPVTNAENTRRGESGIRQREKTHCRRGHPLSGDNLYLNPHPLGGRECRICRKANRQRWERERRGETTA